MRFVDMIFRSCSTCRCCGEGDGVTVFPATQHWALAYSAAAPAGVVSPLVHCKWEGPRKAALNETSSSFYKYICRSSCLKTLHPSFPVISIRMIFFWECLPRDIAYFS